MTTCRWCGQPLEQKHIGRPRIYCGDACRKRHARAFPRIPDDLAPLPDPGPLPRLSPEARLAVITSELRSQQQELARLASELHAALAWRSDMIAYELGRVLDYCIGKVM